MPIEVIYMSNVIYGRFSDTEHKDSLEQSTEQRMICLGDWLDNQYTVPNSMDMSGLESMELNMEGEY